MTDIPTTTIFSLILSLLGFFTVVTGATAFYYKRDSRRSERLELNQRGPEDRETTLGAHWSERPAVWDVWVDKYPKPASKWEDLLPLSMTYDHDQLSTRWPSLRQSPLPPAPQNRGAGWRSTGGVADVQLRESNEGPRPNFATTDCDVSVFIVMPIPREHFSTEFADEFAIGTAEVAYRHPERSHS